MTRREFPGGFAFYYFFFLYFFFVDCQPLAYFFCVTVCLRGRSGFSARFSASFSYFLTTRSVQFAVTFVIDTVLTWLLFRSRLFERAGLWKEHKEEKPDEHDPA